MIRKYTTSYSYLGNRKIRTKFNGITSSERPIRTGEPQGSSIGPHLFNIFINGIITCVVDPRVQITLYADDAIIYTADRASDIIRDKLQIVATNIHDWCKSNYLKINVNKSKICVYGTRSMLDKGVDIEVLIENIKITHCEVYTNLGVQIDECLTLQRHFNHICRRFSPKELNFLN